MNTRKLVLMGALPGILAAACSPYPRTEADFGNSVRHMVTSQTMPAAVDRDPPEGSDSDRLNAVLEALRADVSRGEEGPAPVAVTFGAGAPQ